MIEAIIGILFVALAFWIYPIPLPTNFLNALMRKMGLQGEVGDSTLVNSGVFGLIGEIGVVTKQIDSLGGRVKAGNTEWNARPTCEKSVISVGEKVTIANFDGSTLLVQPINE